MKQQLFHLSVQVEDDGSLTATYNGVKFKVRKPDGFTFSEDRKLVAVGKIGNSSPAGFISRGAMLEMKIDMDSIDAPKLKKGEYLIT